MITIISATNRRGSITRKVAAQVHQMFQAESQELVKFFSLEDLPDDVLHIDMYGSEAQSPALAAIQDEFIVPANKFYFIIPEYNGGYPGVLKLFWDACSIRAYKESFHGGKKAAMLGISSGRAGNLRGMEHFTGVLNYLQITVMPPHQPISSIEKMIDEAGQINDAATLKAIEGHVRKFVSF